MGSYSCLKDIISQYLALICYNVLTIYTQEQVYGSNNQGTWLYYTNCFNKLKGAIKFRVNCKQLENTNAVTLKWAFLKKKKKQQINFFGAEVIESEDVCCHTNTYGSIHKEGL